MKGFKAAIDSETIENTDFRRVLYTSEYSQLVLMSLPPGEEIGLETHEANDQFFRVENGRGKCVIDGNEYQLRDGDAVVVPRGVKHNIINLSDTDDLKLYTIYSPPHHKDGIVKATKSEAAANEEEFDGTTTEVAKSR
ncbi:MAG: cupin domain-containing protein [Pyrinomonadaceae bacterium]